MNQERKNRLQSIRLKLANLSESEKAALTSRGLIATVEGRTLGLHNTLLVYVQGNGTIPTVVGGYQQWKRAGKQVKKGEHGYTIWFPVGSKDENGDITEATKFYTGTVFDISQVESKDKATVTLPLGNGNKSYKHSYNIYSKCTGKAKENVLKQLEAIDKYDYSKPKQPYTLARHPGPAKPYGDIEIIVDGKPGLSLNDGNKPGLVKSFMRQQGK